MDMIIYYYDRRRSIKNASWEESVQILLDNLCQYITCGNQCRMNKLMAQCGEKSNQVLIEFYRRLVSPLKQIIIEVGSQVNYNAFSVSESVSCKISRRFQRLQNQGYDKVKNRSSVIR
uniref:Uncharacterized protein n=1 Tax=Romanomermis culicivorax TaxID=13658 RepID=A0A915J8K7_ROMCU